MLAYISYMDPMGMLLTLVNMCQVSVFDHNGSFRRNYSDIL